VDISQKKKLIDRMVDTIQLANDLRDEIEMKDQMIDALQIKLREKKNQIDDMIDATCAIEGFIQMIDAACDTNEFIQKVDAACDTQDIMQMIDVVCDS
jgi:predicted RNase H-like nuclease (RuvC/YqgF family)